MYSVSKMKFDRKPPLAKSPTRLRPRRVLRSNSTSLQTPPGSLTKSEKPNRKWDTEEPELRPEYRSISYELRALAKMVRDEFGKEESNNANNGGVSNSLSANSSPVFERGRFYEEYSARRNERLSRKKSEDSRNERKSVYNLGVTVESAKRGSTSKKLESLRKSVSAAYSLEPPTPRYMLRSMSKDSKKPPLATTFGKSVIGSDRKVGGARRVRRD